MSPSFALVPAGPLVPDGLAALRCAAEEEGIGIVSRIVVRWVDGTERYTHDGEAIVAAVGDGEVVGVGGLTRCPDVAGALRMRRIYVHPAWRRRGVGAALATELIEVGFEGAAVLTCNARASAAAPAFWERMGFVPADDAGITHSMRRGA